MAIESVAPERAVAASNNPPKMKGDKVNVFYGDKQALQDVDLEINTNEVRPLSAPQAAESPPFCAASTG